MSPIRLRHVLLTQPQSPINRSIPKAFQHTKTSLERSWKTSRYLEHKQYQRRFKSTEALVESSPEASRKFKNLNFEYEEHSKRNHPNHLSRSQRSLESPQKPPETSTNHKSVKLYGFKPLKHRRTSTTNLQRRRTHKEHKKREEQRISNKLKARYSL